MKYLSESLKSIGKILLLMYVVTAMLLFLLAVLVQRFNWESNLISIGISVVYIVSCFMIFSKFKALKYCMLSPVICQLTGTFFLNLFRITLLSMHLFL